MKINKINIEKFAKDEYSNTAPNKDGINGRNLLIFGENRSGKTLTFNAILYSLLGSQETIDLSTGRGNRVTLSFSNEVTFARGTPKAELSIDGDTYLGENAVTKFADLLCDSSLLKSHFLHSHIDRLPLSRLNKDERLTQIRLVSNEKRQKQLDWTYVAKDQISNILVETQDTLRRIKEDQPDLTTQISSAEQQLEKHRTRQSLIESGQLERISEQLLRNQELNEELDELFSEQEALRQQLNRLNKQKRRHEGYTEEVIDIIAEAVNDFLCPACDRRVTTTTAKDRMESGYCPYCRQEGSIQDVKNRLSDRVENATEIVDELEEDISELQQRQSEISAEIDAVKSQKPELSNLDAAIKRKLKEYDYDIERIAAATREEIQSTEKTLEELREAEDELEEEIEMVEHQEEVYKESLTVAENSIAELEESSYDREILEFSEKWTKNYRAMAGDLGFEIGIDPDGKVIVPGGTEDGDRRHYDRRGDLSDSELRLLNISYAYTLNEIAVASGATDWKVFVLDEPFANLDQASTDVLLDYFLNCERQFIISTSNEDIKEHFDDYHTIMLKRGPMQSELGEFV